MIFEPDLDLDQIAWAAGFEDDPEIFVELRDEIGQPAWSYLARLAGRGAEKPDAEAERWSRLREALADAFVLALKHLSFADRRRLARDAIWFPDLTFFEQLSRRSREAAADRDDDGDPAQRVERGDADCRWIAAWQAPS